MTTLPDTRLLEERKGVVFVDCLVMCVHSDLRAEWERLNGKKLVPANPIDRLVDQATGYDLDTMREFADFVYTYIFSLF